MPLRRPCGWARRVGTRHATRTPATVDSEDRAARRLTREDAMTAGEVAELLSDQASRHAAVDAVGCWPPEKYLSSRQQHDASDHRGDANLLCAMDALTEHTVGKQYGHNWIQRGEHGHDS